MSSPSPGTSPTPPSNTTSPPPNAAVSPPPPVPATSPPPAASPPPPTPSATPPPSTTPSPPASTPPPTSTPSPPSIIPPAGSPPSPPAPDTGGGSSPAPPTGGNSPSVPSGGGSPPSVPSGGGSPPSSSGGSPPSSSGGGSSGVSAGLVVGVVIGVVAVIAVLSLIYLLCRKKKRRGQPDYYVPPPPPPGHKADPYGAPAHNWQQSAQPPPDHLVTVPPKLSPPPGGASRPPPSPYRASSPQPPPPPAYISSSGGSGSNYSGGAEAPYRPPSPGMSLGFSQSTFTYEDLAMATDGFSDANLLGQGGFGFVHRGLLPNGKEVAVKQLKAGSGQGEREFQAEVEIISRVHHRHLVSLVGYCITGTRRMLVYEFVPNNTLEFHLHEKGRPVMDWPARLKIALGAARGLAYLHEDCHPKIIHRDIKASNILVDFNFEAKVADFGLAKLTSDANTHVSTRVMGTFGYLAPEYAASGKLTEKSDVFSFGVMLLELITGRRPVDINQSFTDDSLVDWARPLLTRALEDGNFDTLIDQRLQNDYNHNEMARMVACAAACVRHSSRRRPPMSQVVRALEGNVSLSDLNDGTRPGHSTVYSSHGSSDYDTSQYKEDMEKFRKMALGTQEYGTSNPYSNPTSEYGLNPSSSSSEGQQTREMEMRKMRGDSGGA